MGRPAFLGTVCESQKPIRARFLNYWRTDARRFIGAMADKVHQSSPDYPEKSFLRDNLLDCQ
jgi:hypothetical protein